MVSLTRRVRQVVPIALAATILLAGCGGSSGGPSTPRPTVSPLTAAAYKQALSGISRQETLAQQAVGKALHARTVGALATALSAFADDQRKVAAELSALRPPADAVTANGQLAAAFAANARATHAIGVRIATASSVKQALSELMHASAAQRTGQRIDAALTKLRKLGYTKGR